MIKTENDYIAEYIIEKRPELIKSFDYVFWKMAAMVRNFSVEIAEAFKKTMSDEMETEAADDPEFEDEEYYDFVTKKGMEYCHKHRGSNCMCENCPLRENLYCINEAGSLIINEDCTALGAAASQYAYMIQEVTKHDQNNDVAK